MAGITDLSETGPVYRDDIRKRRPREGEDPLPQRTICINGLRAGDELAIASMDVLGTGREDLRRAAAAIGSKGAAIYDCATGRVVPCTPDALALSDAIERGTTELHRQRADVARSAKRNLGHAAKGGRRILWSPAQYAKAKPTYFDLTLTQDEIQKRTGIPYRTLHRKFGKRGAPIFGRGRAKADG